MKRLLPYLQAMMLVFLLVANTSAQDSQKRDVSKLDADKLLTLAEIKQHMRYQMGAYSKRFRTAKTAKEKSEVVKTIPNVLPYHPVMSKLVAEGTDTEANEILSWWWHGARGKRDAEMMTELLVEHHIESEILEKFVPRIRWAMEPEKAESYLRKVFEGSSVKSVKATSAFSLSQLLVLKAETAKGKPAELLQTELKSLTQSLKTEYAEFTDLAGVTFGDRIEGLEYASQLEIGKSVPDIAGTDLEGVEFKLSDYKDNVVMVSFWGQW